MRKRRDVSLNAEDHRPQPVGPGPWRGLLLPVFMITAMGAMAVLFLITCNRVPTLQTVANRLDRRIEEEQQRRLELCRQLVAAKDAPSLRAYAAKSGLTQTNPPEDIVSLPQLLPAAVEPSPFNDDTWQTPVRKHETTTLAQRHAEQQPHY